MALFPFILVKKKDLKQDPILIRHEQIHHRQQLELLLIGFYVWYVLEFLIRLIYYQNHDLAYRNISFEREAFCHDAEEEYLKNRKLFGFFKYLWSDH